MERQPATIGFRFLTDAIASLHGYFVNLWFRHYLDVITENYRRLSELGLIKDIAVPTESGRYSLPFDFKALNMEKISYINGIYFYILSSHKSANHCLMNQHERKQVLYLRGYDSEGSVRMNGRLMKGHSTIDTYMFSGTLKKLLSEHFMLFKILSSRDLYWETIDAQQYFYGELCDMIPLTRDGMFSVFCNALNWKKDVINLLDRMDHYIVYVSSMSESLLWELDQLDSKNRRDRVTVVFDERSFNSKEWHLEEMDRIKDKFPENVEWYRKGQPPNVSISEFREQLSKKFLVTSPDEFEKHIVEHCRRINQSCAPLSPGARETFLEFHFFPSLDEIRLKDLRNFQDEVNAHIINWTSTDMIDCLPLFFNIVQLRILLSLMMGEHHETGRALAVYAAIIKGVQDYYTVSCDKIITMSNEEKEDCLNLLSDHFNMASHISWRMLTIGKSYQFDDLTSIGETVFNEAFGKTIAAVEHFFTKSNYISRNYLEPKQLDIPYSTTHNSLKTKYKDNYNYTKEVINFKNDSSLKKQAISYCKQGTEYHISRDYKRAIKLFNDALVLDPSCTTAYFSRGATYVHIGENDLAMKDFNKALNIDPNDDKALVNRGLLYYHLNDYKNALKDYNRALEINPNNSLGCLNRGILYSDLDNNRIAFQDLDRAIKIEPHNYKLFEIRGQIYFKMGDHLRSIKEYDSAIKLNPLDHKLLNGRGLSYDNKGDSKTAIVDYSEALKLCQTDYLVYFNRGVAYHKLKDYDSAIKDYDCSIRLNCCYYKSFRARGLAFYDIKKYKHAAKNFKQALKINPRDEKSAALLTLLPKKLHIK